MIPTTPNSKITAILSKLWNDAWGKLGMYQYDGTGTDTLTKDQAATQLQQLMIEVYDKGYEDGERVLPPKLVDALKFRQEQYGWDATKMATMLDMSKSHYSEFMHGKRQLPINAVRKAYAIGIPANVLLQDDIANQLKAQLNKE